MVAWFRVLLCVSLRRCRNSPCELSMVKSLREVEREYLMGTFNIRRGFAQLIISTLGHLPGPGMTKCSQISYSNLGVNLRNLEQDSDVTVICVK